jgi:type VI secretion system protein ImpK
MAKPMEPGGPGRPTPPLADPMIELFVTQALLARAAELARRGRYAEAEQILRPLAGAERPPAAALDLLARIHAQQGRLAEAEAAWKLVLGADPGNAAARAGLARIERMHQTPWARVLPLRALGVAALLLLAIGFGYLLRRDVRLLRRSVSEQAALTARALTSGAAESEKAAERQKAGPVAPDKPDATMARLAGSLGLAGMKAVPEGPALLVIFDAGLFEKGAELTPQAQVMLTRLGRLLRSHEKPLTVQITGCTDDLPLRPGAAYADNTALGYARAQAVAEHLRRAPGFPAERLLLRSAGELTPPYQNDTPVNRLKNRTAVLRIFSSAEGASGAT